VGSNAKSTRISDRAAEPGRSSAGGAGKRAPAVRGTHRALVLDLIEARAYADGAVFHVYRPAATSQTGERARRPMKAQPHQINKPAPPIWQGVPRPKAAHHWAATCAGARQAVDDIG
jgi:hypothetical protein